MGFLWFYLSFYIPLWFIPHKIRSLWLTRRQVTEPILLPRSLLLMAENDMDLAWRLARERFRRRKRGHTGTQRWQGDPGRPWNMYKYVIHESYRSYRCKFSSHISSSFWWSNLALENVAQLSAHVAPPWLRPQPATGWTMAKRLP